jgi:hypothetical protein
MVMTVAARTAEVAELRSAGFALSSTADADELWEIGARLARAEQGACALIRAAAARECAGSSQTN